MKKSYIVLIIVAVLGVEAIVLYPSKNDNETSVASADASENTTDVSSVESTPSQAETTAQNSTQTSTNVNGTSLSNGTFTGSNESTPFGDLKISIIVSAGNITDVTFLAVPENDRKSIQINDEAIPMLESQTIKAQSVDIDGVSGATYTSDAYINSLQSAIDAAKGA